MVSFIYRYRLLIIVVSVLVSAAAALMIPSAETDPDIRNYIPGTMQSRANTDRIEETFGVQDIAMILFRDSCILNSDGLKRISDVTEALAEIRGVSDVMSIANSIVIRGEEGYMLVEPAMAEVPQTAEDVELLKESLWGNPLIMGSVLSEDLTTASVIVYLDSLTDELVTLAAIDSVLQAYPGTAEVMKGGLPYIRAAIMSDVRWNNSGAAGSGNHACVATSGFQGVAGCCHSLYRGGHVDGSLNGTAPAVWVEAIGH